jgi:hypothetical protein
MRITLAAPDGRQKRPAVTSRAHYVTMGTLRASADSQRQYRWPK